MLRDRRIWALFVLREDYLALLDRDARFLPTHLTYIEKPTENTPRKYAAGVVQALAENLAKVKVQEGIGGYIEPLQLQMV